MDIEHLYIEYKPLLFSIAYRMLGCVSDAEDIVQDTFLTVQQLDPAQVQHMKAYLCKMVTNRCLDFARSARRKRELYVGPWLPEPLLQTNNDPLEAAVQGDSLSYAFMVYMERLTPVERAVFVLREAFDYEYGEIGGILHKSEANCRQIYSRLKRKLQEDRPASPPAPEYSGRLVQEFIHASSTGNMNALIQTLSEEVVIYSDGGGKALAALRPIIGRERVIRFLLGTSQKNRPMKRYAVVMMNGGPGIIVLEEGRVVTAINWDWDVDGRLKALYMIRNPDKLAGFTPERIGIADIHML